MSSDNIYRLIVGLHFCQDENEYYRITRLILSSELISPALKKYF